jgi:mono/diheme cytochrome c family protein
MAKRPVTLVAPAYRDTVDAGAIRQVIRDGKGRMEGYGEKLGPDGIDALARYVLELPPRDGEP